MPNPKYKKHEDLIAIALRQYAYEMCQQPGEFNQTQGKNLDRALRSCKGISDIDVVWVQWSYIADKYCWRTDHEMEISPKTGYRYPC